MPALKLQKRIRNRLDNILVIDVVIDATFHKTQILNLGIRPDVRTESQRCRTGY